MPGQSVDNSVIGGSNIQIGSATGDVVILLDHPDYRLEFLTPVEAETIERGSRAPGQPSYLLDPQHQVVPYRRRPVEQERIQRWLDAPEPVSVLLVTGPGGQGKTRLAGHIATHCCAAGWAVAQAVERSPQLRPGRPGGDVLGDERPLLVVCDYAERWGLALLVRLIAALPGDYPGRRLRVLLLARPAVGLWEEIAAQLDRCEADLPDPLALGEIDSDRVSVFADAAAAFAARRGVPVPAAPTAAALVDPVYNSPLGLHMAALAAVFAVDAEGGGVPDSAGDLSRFLLRHERRGWIAISGTASGSGPGRDVFGSWWCWPLCSARSWVEPPRSGCCGRLALLMVTPPRRL